MTQIPWRSSVKHHPEEAIGSLVIRLAPKGLLTPGVRTENLNPTVVVMKAAENGA